MELGFTCKKPIFDVKQNVTALHINDWLLSTKTYVLVSVSVVTSGVFRIAYFDYVGNYEL